MGNKHPSTPSNKGEPPSASQITSKTINSQFHISTPKGANMISPLRRPQTEGDLPNGFLCATFRTPVRQPNTKKTVHLSTVKIDPTKTSVCEKLARISTPWQPVLLPYLQDAELVPQIRYLDQVFKEDYSYKKKQVLAPYARDRKKTTDHIESMLMAEEKLAAHISQSLLFGAQYESMMKSNGPVVERLAGMYNQKEVTPYTLTDEKKESPSNSTVSPSIIRVYPNNTLLLSPSSASAGGDVAVEITYYKMVTDLIEKHLNDRENVFGLLIKKFRRYLFEAYEEKLLNIGRATPGQETQTGLDKVYNSLMYDVRTFIEFTCDCVRSTYKLASLASVNPAKSPLSPFEKNQGLETSTSSDLILCRDTMMAFVSSVLFNDPLYALVFSAFKLKYKQDEDILLNRMEHFCNENITFWGTQYPFTLADTPRNDADMKNYYETIFDDDSFVYTGTENQPQSPNRKSNSGIYEEMKMEKEHDPARKLVKCHTTERLDVTSNLQARYNNIYTHGNEAATLMSNTHPNGPYSEAIDNLRMLNFMKSPLHKMKTLMRTAELIHSAVGAFTSKLKNRKIPEMDADQLFTIIVYTLVRSGVGNMRAHIKFIEAFSTRNLLNSLPGYYCTSYEAALEHLVELKNS